MILDKRQPSYTFGSLNECLKVDLVIKNKNQKARWRVKNLIWKSLSLSDL